MNVLCYQFVPHIVKTYQKSECYIYHIILVTQCTMSIIQNIE